MKSPTLSQSRPRSLPSGRAATGSKFDPDLLNAADAAFKAAIALDPKNCHRLLLDGQVLAHLGQTEAARDQFKACLQCIKPKRSPSIFGPGISPKIPLSLSCNWPLPLRHRSRRLPLQPRRRWAAASSSSTSGPPGAAPVTRSYLTSSRSPKSSPASHSSSQHQLGLRTRQMEEFIEKNEMTWAQYRDADHRLRQALRSRSTPRLLHHRLRRRPHRRDARRRLRRRRQTQEVGRQKPKSSHSRQPRRSATSLP